MAEPGAEPKEATPPPGPARVSTRARSRSALPLIVGGLAGLVVIATLAIGSASMLRDSRASGGAPAAAPAPAGKAPIPQSLSPAPVPIEPPVPADPPGFGTDQPPPVEDRLARLEAANEVLARQASDLAAALSAVGGDGSDLRLLALRLREGLVLDMAQRRLERGIPLGELERHLALSHAVRDPEAVVALLAWSRAPVAPADLQPRLAAIAAAPAPAGTPDGTDAGWLKQVRGWFASLVQVRRASGDLPAPARLAQASQALAAGDIARAIGLLDGQAHDARLASWMADARRVAAAKAALERLELRLIDDLDDRPRASAAPGNAG